MFSVKDYANEMGITVQEVLKKCTFLGIKAANAEDMLEEDDVIMLDNAIDILDSVEDTEEDYSSSEDEEALVIENEKKDTKRFNDRPKKNMTDSKSNYAKKRKEMYKHKEKLQSVSSNEDENIVLYKENMSIADLATSLDVKGNDIIVKLMSMGLMISLNEAIDFENAEIIALEYGKTLKRSYSRCI